MADKKKDNSTLRQKVLIRQLVLKEIKRPVVMETHGGEGWLYRLCYVGVPTGVVFEKKPERAAILAQQRPAWAVYECDCVPALQGGAGAHLEVNLVDVDPHGDPWPAIGAFFESDRPRPRVVWLVVNDGLRQKVRMGGAWSTESMKSMVSRFGNNLHAVYLEVCQELLEEKAAQAKYRLDRFVGYYTGHAKQLTHYAARVTR